MKVRSLKLQDVNYGKQWDEEIHDRWVYDDFVANKAWREGWISFDSALYRPEDDQVYLGVTCFDENRIFAAYDRKADQFVDLDYRRVAEKHDAKFHRSLVRGDDGCLYAAPALLHCCDKYFEAPGASIIKYDPVSGEIEKLGIPMPHIYIQSLAIDSRRQVLYCLHYGPEYISSFDLRSKETKVLASIGSGCVMTQGENIVLDDDGCLWSNWSLTRAWQEGPGPYGICLCKYDPKADRMNFFNTGLPYPDGAEGFAKSEAFFNFGDGAVYASGANGSLYRIDPSNGQAEYLFTPISDRPSRLSSMAKTEDGVAYGVTGRWGQCELIRVEYKQGKYELLGPIVDADGEPMCQCHDIVATDDGVLYACENDNPNRSSYLWEIRL